MNTYKCRASAAWKLMTNPRSKTETLSQTSKTHLDEWMKEAIYGIRREVSSKEISKGLTFEDMAIDKTIEWLDLPFAIKNTARFEDDYFSGEPDLLLNDEVIDIKNSWDCWTFPLFASELPTDDYYFQVQVYMHLTGKRKARVVYVLLNTPETYNTPEIDYSHVDHKYRIKAFEVAYDQNVIDTLIERIKDARKYIETKFF